MKPARSTILIPTYNRPQLLFRLLQFIIENFDLTRIEILVLDGSDDESINKEICSMPEIQYCYYGSKMPVLDRWLDGIKNTRTEFVSLLADDDMVEPGGYWACLDFLLSNPDYSIAHGNYIWFLEQGGKVSIYPGYKTFSIEHESPLVRLFAFLADYAPISYGIYRTDILKIAYEKTISGLKSNNLHFIELLSGCIPVLLGKVKKLDVNFYGRRIGDSSPRPNIDYLKLVFSQDFSKQYGEIKYTLTRFLDQKIQPEIIDDALDYCFGAYYGRILSRDNVARNFNDVMQKAQIR